MAGESNESNGAGNTDADTEGVIDNETGNEDEGLTMVEAISQGLDQADETLEAEEGDTSPDKDINAAAEEAGDDAAPTEPTKENKSEETEGDKSETDLEKKEDENELEQLYSSENLKGKTRERFEKLTTYSKERDNKLSEAEENLVQRDKTLNDMSAMIADTGADNEQYVQSLQLLKLINNDPEQAILAMQTTIKELSKANKIQVDGMDIDMLEGHDDLRQKVDDGYITEEAALEVVKARDITARADKTKKNEDSSTKHHELVESTKGEIMGMLGKWNETDVDFPMKAEELVAAADFCGKNLPPEKWKSYMEDRYNQITKMARRLGRKGNGKREAPLRSSTSTSSGGQPKSMLEAVNQGLGG